MSVCCRVLLSSAGSSRTFFLQIDWQILDKKSKWKTSLVEFCWIKQNLAELNVYTHTLSKSLNLYIFRQNLWICIDFIKICTLEHDGQQFCWKKQSSAGSSRTPLARFFICLFVKICVLICRTRKVLLHPAELCFFCKLIHRFGQQKQMKNLARGVLLDPAELCVFFQQNWHMYGVYICANPQISSKYVKSPLGWVPLEFR